MIHDAMSEARNTHALPMSSGVPRRVNGAAFSHLATPSGHCSSMPGRAIRPGETVLTRMPRGPYSNAAARACMISAAFEAA